MEGGSLVENRQRRGGELVKKGGKMPIYVKIHKFQQEFVDIQYRLFLDLLAEYDFAGEILQIRIIWLNFTIQVGNFHLPYLNNVLGFSIFAGSITLFKAFYLHITITAILSLDLLLHKCSALPLPMPCSALMLPLRA